MKKGFTLVELMGVIIILGVIALVSIPAVDKILKDARNDMSDTSLKSIKVAAQLWATDNPWSLPGASETCYLKYDTLVNGGYLEPEMTDPKTKVNFTNYNTYVAITKVGAKYEYSVEFDMGATDTEDNSIEPQEHICAIPEEP